MPLTLERIAIVPASGLPRITAYNENHDEQGRFAEGDSAGGAGASSSGQSAGIKNIAQKIQDVVDQSKTRSEMATKLKEVATKAKEEIKNHVVSAIEKTKAELTAYPESVRGALGREIATHAKDFAKDLIDHVNHETRYTISQLKDRQSRDQIKEVLDSAHENLGPAGVQSQFNFNAGYLRDGLTERFRPVATSDAHARSMANHVVSRLAANLGLSHPPGITAYAQATEIARGARR